MASVMTESTNVLPLFWHLSAPSTSARLDATEALVSTLDKFQTEWSTSRHGANGSGHAIENGKGKGKGPAKKDVILEHEVEGDDEEDSDGAADSDDDVAMDALSSSESGMEVSDDSESDGSDDPDPDRPPLNPLDRTFDTSNSPDVVYTLKRLIRGLSSSRPNARLGFSVALTSLLGQLGKEGEGVEPGPGYVLDLVLRNSVSSKSMRGQEERDLLFARLFGLTAILESGILFQARTSSSDSQNEDDQTSSGQAPVETYLQTIHALLDLSNAKSWIRESSIWSLITSLRTLISLAEGDAPEWRDEAVQGVVKMVFGGAGGNGENGERALLGWGQEKVALAIVLRGSGVDVDWKTLLSPLFKHGNVLHSANLPALGKILKDTNALEASTTSQTSTWKPQPHFVWEIILDEFAKKDGVQGKAAEVGDRADFGEFFRVVIEETLFDPSSTPQRKYWGFVVVQRLLPTLPASELPMVFTKNFMKVWMNHLSGEDRYLHKIAQSIAKQLPEVTKSNPLVGFTLISQLIGSHGSQNFDRLTKTKTVESVMGSLTVSGVEQYLAYLKGIFAGSGGTSEQKVVQQDEMESQKKLDSQRIWATEQMLALLRNVQVPKADGWIWEIVELFLVHGLFTLKSADKKSNIAALQKRMKPELSEQVKVSCRNKFYAAIIELAVQPRTVKEKDGRMRKLQGKDESGQLWIARAVDLVAILEKDSKHVAVASEVDAELAQNRTAALQTLHSVRKASSLSSDLAQGLEVVLSFAWLQAYGDDAKAHDLLDDARACAEALCQPAASSSKQDAELPPLDLLLDVLLAYLEKGSADLRSLSTFVFGLISSSATASTIEHLIAQLEHVGGADSDDEEEADLEDEEEDVISVTSGADEVDEEDDLDESDDDDEGDSAETESEDEAMDVDPEFRRRIAEALKVEGGAASPADGDTNDSDEEDSIAANDEEMLQIDEKLAAIFKQQATKGRRGLKARTVQNVHFKARVLDLVEIFMRKQSASPLTFTLIPPLLTLAANAGIAEKPLSTKASSVLSGVGRAAETPMVDDPEMIKEVLAEVHRIARTNPSKELAKICNECSIVLAKAAGHATSFSSTSTIEDSPVLATYRDSLKDLLTRKNSKVQSSIFDDFFKRQPLQSWPLRTDLLQYIQEDKVNGLHLRMAFGLVSSLSRQFAVIAKSVSAQEMTAFLVDVRKALYAALTIHGGPDGTWQESWVKDLIKHGLQISRFSKVVCTTDEQLSTVWAATELANIEERLQKVERLASFPSVFSLLAQLRLLIDPQAKEAQQAKKAAKQQEKKRKRADEVAQPASIAVEESEGKPKKKKAKGEAVQAISGVQEDGVKPRKAQSKLAKGSKAAI